jgi:hypothetical protein
MRYLTEHVVNPANDRIHIAVTDEPGAGGANHKYQVTFGDGPETHVTHINFQNGPIPENGVNGLTQEVLLAIVADRLRCFQAGPFACAENAEALRHVQLAQETLQNRTRARMARGVEGTHTV